MRPAPGHARLGRLALASLALAGCSVAPLPLPTPTAAPTAERTAVPTLTPPPPPSATLPPSPTPAPSDTAPPPSPTADTLVEPGGGELLFEEPFNAAGTWGVEDTETHAIAVADGALRITIKAADWRAFALSSRLADFYLEVTATAADCGGEDSYGVLYRYVDADNFYYFGLGCGARYRARHYQDGEWKELINWTQADVVASGEGENGERVLGLRAVGERFYFFANGQFLAEAADSALADGRLALLANSSPEAGLSVAFDDLRVYAPAP
jgi:hypothetical protein